MSLTNHVNGSNKASLPLLLGHIRGVVEGYKL